MAVLHGEVMKEASLTLGNLVQLLGILLATIVFLYLIGLDLSNAIKKGANWVPGHALVLSALTIQAMQFVENQGALLDQMLDSSQPLSGEVVKNTLLMIHSSRVMLCVLVAFFLPGMARPGYQEKWTKIIALGLSVFLDIFSELLTVHRRLRHSGLNLVTYFFYTWPHAKQVNVLSFIVSGAIITMTLIWLMVLLVCATIASKSIRNLTTQRILFILGKPKDDTWKELEDQVLKSWVVSRACHPESIIASSVLGSSAAFGVTVCIICSMIGWIFQGPAIKFLGGAVFWFKFIITIAEVIFIVIGWAILGWRWLTSVAYYGNDQRLSQTCRQIWSQYFPVEDFWTRHLVELREAEESNLSKLKVDERLSKIFARKLRNLKVDQSPVSIMIPPEVKKRNSLKWMFLVCVLWLQWLVVFVSKAYCFITEITLYHKLIRCLASRVLKNHVDKVKEDYGKDQNIVYDVKFLWQTPKSVYSTNRKSIRQAKEIIRMGNKDGESCHVLIALLEKNRSRQAPVVAESLGQRGLKFLCRVRVVDDELDVERYFMYASKWSWKLTAVSLITIIGRLCPPCERDARDCLQAYYEAWELMDMVDESYPETHRLLSKAADSRFNALCKAMEAAKAAQQVLNGMEEAITAIQKECKEKVEETKKIINAGQDTPLDWENLVAGNALYKLCKSIDCSSANFDDLMKELHTSLEDIISGCLELVGPALVDKCRKWAQDSERKNLREALYVAGKSRGLMERLPMVPGLQTAVPQKEDSASVSVTVTES